MENKNSVYTVAKQTPNLKSSKRMNLKSTRTRQSVSSNLLGLVLKPHALC